jgi:hypothetical protein
LEGCMVSGLKPTDADMKTGNTLVNLAFSLTIDRYYPKDLRKMIFGNANVASTPSTLL